MGSTFEQRKKSSVYWFNKASDLRGAAAVLWASMKSRTKKVQADLDLGSGYRFNVALPLPYRMLCGMSLELLLKALIVERGLEPRLDHNLPRLAADAGIMFDADQIPLLEILSEAIYWDGRYPVPTDESKWEKLYELEDAHLFDKSPLGETSKLMLRTRNDALDWESYSELWSIAASELFDIASWVERSDEGVAE